jgi:hypothetical protein
MDDMRLDPASNKPARQPEAVAASLIGQRDLPGLTMYDLRVGKHKFNIRFWREDEQTAFEVIGGDPKLVERCHLASMLAQLRIGSGSI